MLMGGPLGLSVLSHCVSLAPGMASRKSTKAWPSTGHLTTYCSSMTVRTLVLSKGEHPPALRFFSKKEG